MDAEENATRSDEVKDKKRMSYKDEHEAYAAARVTQFVFQPSKDTYFTTLDQHADTLENDVKPPLVLLGDEGSGKSSLLANWLAKRKEKKHKDEFLFQHYVGCSTPSLQLSHTLFRLETALKDFFQLREMKVPDSESDLRWSLNRFLAAAAKKHSPARIVIIIDCVHRLKADGVPDGSLHWLPIDLPPCVRFIISTVENEHSKYYISEADKIKHKTFVELTRRGYTILKMDKISVPICNNIIGDYIKLNDGAIELSEHQQFKIVTAPAAIENPMFLRSLLQSLLLAKTVTTSSVDSLLESFLRCTTAYELIDKCLNICNDFLVQEYEQYKGINKILGNMFSVVYASRNGLSEIEIWGILGIVSKTYPDESLKNMVFAVLQEFTMIVNDLHSFSHKIYGEVIYSKYIANEETLKKWHFVMARYFGELDPCPRKIVALPHHLEYAGAWSKVKNCLTEIDMFKIWWQPEFRKEFLKFWASLTAFNPEEDEHTSRPIYDVVEEYVKSLDEFRTKKHPKDEEVADIILVIGEFLIEFATLGHEESADVPSLFHPEIPSEDLKSIGVPYIELETDGKNTYGALKYPKVYEELGPVDEKAAFENPKAYDDLPVCSAYFFHRWMWIQFPYIALGSCSSRYDKGIDMLKKELESGMVKSSSMFNKGNTDEHGRSRLGRSTDTLRPKDRMLLQASRMLSQSLTSLEPTKLPEIKFVRKAPKTQPKIPLKEREGGNAVLEAYNQRMEALKDEVQAYRDEHDFIVQIKTSKLQKLAELKGQTVELARSGECVSQYDNELNTVVKREEDASRKAEAVVQVNRNLQNLYSICERHPPNVPALVQEINFKLAQDIYIIKEIKARLWEQKFEMGNHYTTFRDARRLIQAGNEMRNRLITQREDVKTDLEHQHINGEREILSRSGEVDLRRQPNGTVMRHTRKGEDDQPTQVDTKLSWAEIWSGISKRTGIMEPEIFFRRFNNADVLANQIHAMKANGEARVEALKVELSALDEEFDNCRHDVLFGGTLSNKELLYKLSEKQQETRHKKEICETLEELEHKVDRGFDHISELLGVSVREKNSQVTVTDIIMDVETVLDTLMEEREKQTQSQVPGGALDSLSQNSRLQSTVGPEMHNRPAELEFVLLKYENPQTRLPYKLPSRAVEADDEEEDDFDDSDAWDRAFIKTRASQTSRKKLRGKGGSKAVLKKIA